MSHQKTYQNNQAYAQVLDGWDDQFYAKYADALKPGTAGGRALDVGCGVGKVVQRWIAAGIEGYGVDVSEPNIQRAQKITPRCQIYDGRKLPFKDGFFHCVGSLNVLEHVEQPETFIDELVRVVMPGGRVVISSPNFYRVIGFRDYHRQMRGIVNKWKNWRRLGWKKRQMKAEPASVAFDRMTPVFREPFVPDDDAIVATNPLDICFFLEKFGCEIVKVQCTDRYVNPVLDFLLNLTPARRYMFNVFVVARKNRA
jgi:SAM-dependent methyltransferase